MICYRDMTFCPFHADCSGADTCGRALTEEVRAKAKAWWGGMEDGPPICVFTDKPSCHSSIQT